MEFIFKYWPRLRDIVGHAIAQSVADFPQKQPRFEPGSGQVGFVVDKVALGQVLSRYFGSPANLHSTKFSILTITWGRYNRTDVANVQHGPGMDSTPHYATLKINSF
jgi:hypothetical protein